MKSLDKDPNLIKLRGVSFTQATTSQLVRGEYLKVLRQPDNPHDPNAIAVVRTRGEHQNRVGYIPKDLAPRISAEIAGGVRYLALVEGLMGQEEDMTTGVVIRLIRVR